MKKLFIVANWKANKTLTEAALWMEKVKTTQFPVSGIENKEIIICPPYHLLSLILDYLADTQASEKLLMRAGSQNVSQFTNGAFTGELPALLLRELCAYSIVGHSERREKFFESDEVVHQKLIQSLGNNITPILCVSDINQVKKEKELISAGQDKISLEDIIIAYEPLFAIGTGKTDTPENAHEVIKQIKSEGAKYVLYGGSVKPENIHSFTQLEQVDGVLVGGASLDADTFIQLINNS